MRSRRSLLLLLLLIPAARSPAQDPAAILERATLFGRSPDLVARVLLSIHAAGGVKERELEVSLRRRAGTPIELLMRVVSPAFLSEMAYLSSRDADGRENRWLKTSRGVRKLSQTDRGERLFDSDFSVEDVSPFVAEEYALRYAGAEELSGFRCDLVEAVRKGGSATRRLVWVETETALLRRVDTFDAGGRLVKRYLLVDTQRIGSEVYPMTCTMETFGEKTRTVLTFRAVRTDLVLPDKTFSRGNL